MKILAMKGTCSFLVRLNENEAALVNLEDESVFFDEKGARFLKSGVFTAPVYNGAMQEKIFALIRAEHDRNELKELLIRFAFCGQEPLSGIARDFLNKKSGKEPLIAAITEARHTPFEKRFRFEEAFLRTLELLNTVS